MKENFNGYVLGGPARERDPAIHEIVARPLDTKIVLSRAIVDQNAQRINKSVGSEE